MHLLIYFTGKLYFCNILWLVLKSARLVIEVSHDKKFAPKLDQNINHLMQINICYRFWSKFCAKLWPKYPSCVDLHQKFNMTSNIIANFVTHSLEKRLFLFLSYVKVTQINSVSRNELPSTEFLLSTFEFERQNIAGCCK